MSKTLLGAVLPAKKNLWVALQRVYGIGETRARELCYHIGATPMTRVSDLGQFHLSQLLTAIGSKYVVGQELRNETRENVARLVHIRSYRGMRHREQLPVRGQRSHTNARTQKKLPRRF